MQYRRLGKAGVQVSALSLGGWTTYGGLVTDQTTVRDILIRAYDAGINYFDIADVYANGEAERRMGQVLQLFPRHTLIISSKVFFPMSDDVNDRGLSRKHIMESVNQSLQRVGTDYLDFYFCHRYDEHTPLEETVRAMDDLVHQGKILYWGTSQWSAEQLDAVMALCDERGYYKPAVEQPHYSMFVRDRFENEILPTAEAHGMGLVSFSPLASGLLTGKYDDGIPEDSRLGQIDWIRQSWLDDRDLVGRVKALKPIADDLGINRAQLALAWTLRQPALTSVITGASRLSQLESNLKALDVELSADVLQQIDAILA